MKSFFIVSLLGSLLSIAASAATFNCGVPKNSQGQILMGGSSYQIESSADGNVVLIARNFDTGKLRTFRTILAKTFQGVDGAAYESQGFHLNVSNGLMTLAVNEQFFARCSANTGTPEGTVDVTCANEFLANPLVKCSLDQQP